MTRVLPYPQSNGVPHTRTHRSGLADPAILGIGYDGLVLADAPAAFWKLNETSGTTAADATGNGHDGTWSGSPTLGQAGLFDLAVLLDGSTQFATVSNVTGFPTTGAFTLECLIKPSVAANDAILGYGTYSVTRASLRFFLTDATHIGEAWWSDDYSQVVVGYVGAWHHFVALYDGSKRRVYLDGVQLGTDNTPAGTPNFALSGFLIGRGNGSTESFTGLMQRLAIYNFAFTSAQALAHAKAAGF